MKTLNHFRNQLARSYGHLSWAQVKNKVRRSELDVSDLVAFCDEANRLFYEQQVELSKEEREWISVRDRLPKIGQQVLSFTPLMGRPTLDQYGEYPNGKISFRFRGVTHWMPWPDHPKNNNGIRK